MERTRVVIVGGGFAGFHAAKTLLRSLRGREDIEVTLLNPTDYFVTDYVAKYNAFDHNAVVSGVK